jgi:hypothetical protein
MKKTLKLLPLSLLTLMFAENVFADFRCDSIEKNQTDKPRYTLTFSLNGKLMHDADLSVTTDENVSQSVLTKSTDINPRLVNLPSGTFYIYNLTEKKPDRYMLSIEASQIANPSEATIRIIVEHKETIKFTCLQQQGVGDKL